MRLLLCADGAVGAGALRYLLETYPADITAIAVSGDGPVLDLAQEHGLHPIVWDGSTGLAARLAATQELDLGVLAWWPHLIGGPLLTLPKQGFVNFHPSLLPFNRGKHYNFWAIVEGCPFGVTIHRVDAGIDSGDILFQRRIPSTWTDTGETLYHKAQQAMLELWRESYPTLRAGSLAGRPQDPSSGSLHFAKEIDPASQIDLDARYTARDLLNRLRARTFAGRPACTFTDAGRTWEVRIQITEKP